MRFALLVIAACIATGLLFFSLQGRGLAKDAPVLAKKPEGYPVATLAGGCFWCLESEFRGRPGIVYTIVGYIGGHVENPGYEQVSTGKTGHAEAVEIYYDPAVTSYENILEHFMTSAHDPTQADGQWVDKGPQYRSGIFYHDAAQKQAAEAIIARLTAEERFSKPITTEITQAGVFWPAEEYHQQYYEKYEARTGQEHIRVYLKKQRKKAAH